MQSEKSANVLILRPAGLGGVANYYDTLGEYLPGSYIYCIVHNPDATRVVTKIFSLPGIVYRYLCRLRRVELILLNPSLNTRSFYRDMIFLTIAKIYRKKLVVFFHGWDEAFELKIKNGAIVSWLFRQTYGTADCIIVLGDIFRDRLYMMGVPRSVEIVRETTVVGVKHFSPPDIESRSNSIDREIRCLFMARLVSGKGAKEALEIYVRLKEIMASQKVSLTIVGDGTQLMQLREYVREQEIADVIFSGYLRGAEKETAFREAHVFLYPTRYGEGLPIVILEAMHHGLVIVTTPVGGIPDVVGIEESGVIVDLAHLEDSARQLSEILTCPNRVKTIASQNWRTADNHFVPGVVSARLVQVVESALAK